MDTQATLPSLSELLVWDRILAFAQALFIIVAGFLVARFLSRKIARAMEKYGAVQHASLARRSMFYLIFLLSVLSALRELDFKLGIFIGAAGIISVALGFASQTSVSNVISGLFLLVDRPFKIGDIVKIGETVGAVDSMALLSTRIRTFQNGMVRIPNETLIKTEVLNYTHFPIRRIDIDVSIAYKENIGRVRDILMEVARSHELCLEEPEPLFILKGFGDSSIDILFCVWTVNENYLTVMNGIKEEIKIAFDESGVEIPFPHLSLYTGSMTDPFPVSVMSKTDFDRDEVS